MAFNIMSTAFENGGLIPAVHTCDGANTSPPLAWREVPGGTRSFALIVDDPDAPSGTFTHWVLFNLPAHATGLPEGVPAQENLQSGARQGKNSYGRVGYGGPCPPSGVHRYFFKLYAVNTMFDLDRGISKDQLVAALPGHVLAEAELMGRYQRG